MPEFVKAVAKVSKRPCIGHAPRQLRHCGLSRECLQLQQVFAWHQEERTADDV